MENIDDLWARTLDNIRQKVANESFETWLKNTKAHHLDNDQLIVSAPNEFARHWLENRYTQLIADAIFEVTGANLNTTFITPEEEKDEETINKIKQKPTMVNTNQHQPSKMMLNDKYTFDTFVIGSGNRFAHAASLAVAETREFFAIISSLTRFISTSSLSISTLTERLATGLPDLAGALAAGLLACAASAAGLLACAVSAAGVSSLFIVITSPTASFISDTFLTTSRTFSRDSLVITNILNSKSNFSSSIS